MKKIIVILATVLFMSSCTDYKELGENAGKDAVKIILENQEDISKLISELEILSEEHKDTQTDDEFQDSFEKEIKKLANSSFKYPIFVSEKTEFSGLSEYTVDGHSREDPNFYITIKEAGVSYDPPRFELTMKFVAYDMLNFPYDSYMGYVEVSDGEGNFDEYRLWNDDLKDLFNNELAQTRYVKVDLHTIIEEGFSKEPIEEMILAFTKLSQYWTLKSFKLKGEYDKKKSVASSNTRSDSETISDDEFNMVLDKYEEFLDEYIALLKEAKDNPNSTTVAMESMSLMAKLQTASKKLSSVQGQMSESQVMKFIQLQAKMASSAQTALQ